MSFQVFKVPQVGYSATTKDLSNKNEFKYYMRLVPSDKWQAKVNVLQILNYLTDFLSR